MIKKIVKNKQYYNKSYYQTNRIKIRKQQQKYYQKNKLMIQKRNEVWRKNNKDEIKTYKQINKLKISAQNKDYRTKNLDKIRIRQKQYEQTPKRKAYLKQWRKENPRSKCSQYSYELQDAMNNVRNRDNNTCQWFGCGLTNKNAPIHVHHIFPKSEYPEFELIEQYMICYCANHHGMFHRYREDGYANLITSLVV